MPKRPPQHHPAHWKPYIEKKREVDAKRGTAHERGYGHKWRVARLSYLKKNPLCVECKRENAVTAATVVDHVIPHKGDMKLFWNMRNWQSLCKHHHDQKTMSEGSFGQ